MKKSIVLLGITTLVMSILAFAVSIERHPAMVEQSGTLVSVPQKATDHTRVIKPGASILDKIIYKIKGCEIIHELNDAVALKCPSGITIDGAFEDNILHIMDLQADKQINADDVWELGYDGSGVTVAVLDTGVDTDNQELKDSIFGGKGFGYGTYEDDNGHGTHVSGIITANGVVTNAKGVAPGAKIWMAKVCDSGGSCYTSDIASAIEYVVNENIAKIISISLGGGGTSRENCDSDYLASKVNWAVSNGVTVVAAAGNTAGKVSSPACASKAIAVGAVDKNDVRASFSGTGSALDIMAPGVSIYSSLPNNNYASWSGTSMATPHVAATVALMRQVNSELTDNQIKEALYKTTKDLGAVGWDKYYGWGRVDALASVNYILGVTPTTTTTTLLPTITTISTTTILTPTTTTIPNGCGDGYCAGRALGEDCRTCPVDCLVGSKGVCCGDGKCDTKKGESSLECPVDCL